MKDAATVKQDEVRLSFDDFELQEALRKAISKLGFEYCTAIQSQSLVHTLAGHDVTGRAQTGTGKTAAFLITIIFSHYPAQLASKISPSDALRYE